MDGIPTNSSQSELEIIRQTVQENYGSIMIGTFIGLILYGVSLHQAFRYWILHPTDGYAIRSIVVSLCFLETLHSIATMHTCYHYLVTGYFNPGGLASTVWSLTIAFGVSSLIAITAQLFFARRVSLISLKYKMLALLAGVLLLVKLAGSIAYTIRGFTSSRNDIWEMENQWIPQLALGAATVADVLLSGSLFSVIFKSSAGHERSSWRSAIIIFGINTGLLILIFDLTCFVLALAKPNNGYWGAINIVTVRLYANTLFSVLNSRHIQLNRHIDLTSDTHLLRGNIFARANMLATAERWNVPQTKNDAPSAAIDIRVTTGNERFLDGGNFAGVVYKDRGDRKPAAVNEL
ncbi:uncharacterized protein BXZ73DRAFT_100983 [Epithele typhae]|uniref:uncharacterized protein n=1 Tax=Epithele typhae TaxID=378194 RepID=UPI00200808E1|nr:uncharacterized protein BXZ73DRAFT_100983 [Epithele typhae]KAH9933601.1 hypothetical protein BXZ73DRAFT_100983 [Epithele typhae]